MTANTPRLPAEWETQSGVMLTWPHADSDWADLLPTVMPVFEQLGVAIARHENLLSVCQNHAHAEQLRTRLVAAGAPSQHLFFVPAPSDDTWARDHGPITVLHGNEPELNDFMFNGWGGKFSGTKDTKINRHIARHGALGPHPMHGRDFVLEGGALETDGRGTLLATRSTLITDTRNPGLTQSEVEACLSEWLGIRRFLWLQHGDISGDDTDGHIDTLARFTDPDTIVYSTAPQGDADHAELAAMEAELQALRDEHGRPYRLCPLPFPGVHTDEHGRRLPATYANFLLINSAVLLPVYGVPADQQAIAVLQDACPAREVIAIDCRPIIRQNGSLHCLTMQFPAGVQLANVLSP